MKQQTKKSVGKRPAKEFLGVKVSPETKRQLERAARASTRSLSAELEIQLSHEEMRRGVPEIARVLDLVRVAFTMSGQASAGHDVPPEQWVTNPAAYIAGMRGVVRAMMAGLPNKGDAELARQALMSELLAQELREKTDAR